MTRINVIPVEELSDQHLIAEYRELPRALKWKNMDISDAPNEYCLGKGHVKWARKHWVFCSNRYKELVKEMEYRGFRPLFKEPPLDEINTNSYGYYIATPEDYKLNIKRIKERYLMKPEWYRWTKREKPKYMEV